jgi:hypothetical protein
MSVNETRQILDSVGIGDKADRVCGMLSHGDQKVLEIAIGLRESHRRGFAPVRFPLADRSLKIVPHPSRLLNKKEVLGVKGYDEQIRTAAAAPIGGAQVE